MAPSATPTATPTATPSADPTEAPPMLVRTKIVATLGPAVAGVDKLRALITAGVDVCRLNFSHGELSDHARMLADIRTVTGELDRRVAILGDLGGPKIRVGQVDEDNPEGGLSLHAGDELIIQREPIVGRGNVISCTYPGLLDDVAVGDRVLIEDGLLRFVCVRKEPDTPETLVDRITLRCTAGGVVKTRKGINLPSTKLGLPSITDRDWACVDWAVDNDLDFLALSFVRSAGDLKDLKGRLADRGSKIGVIAKIEKAEAVADIDAIIDVADGLMVARGDLGVEMDLARVPIIQKDLIARCRRAGKPTIVATQMLQSMVENASPTRAEVSDVANAIFDGTDATMLSGETSVGRFPVGSVHVLKHVAEATEQYLLDSRHATDTLGKKEAQAIRDAGPLAVATAAAKAARRLVDTVECRLVVIYSHSGDTARLFATERFGVPVVALSNEVGRLRQMALHYGVLPIQMPRPANLQRLAEDVDALVQERKLAEVGDRIVIVAGRSIGAAGTMNGIVIHTVGRDLEDPCAT